MDRLSLGGRRIVGERFPIWWMELTPLSLGGMAERGKRFGVNLGCGFFMSDPGHQASP